MSVCMHVVQAPPTLGVLKDQNRAMSPLKLGWSRVTRPHVGARTAPNSSPKTAQFLNISHLSNPSFGILMSTCVFFFNLEVSCLLTTYSYLGLIFHSLCESLALYFAFRLMAFKVAIDIVELIATIFLTVFSYCPYSTDLSVLFFRSLFLPSLALIEHCILFHFLPSCLLIILTNMLNN